MSSPLFMCYCFHVAHEPLQVPESTYAAIVPMDDDYVTHGLHHRRTYSAMVKYMDDAIGEIVALLRQRGMWASTFVAFQTDNGGPSFLGSKHTANNYPLKGSKITNWEGGIRGNAFVSGGFLQARAPSRVGAKLTGYTHICDWYATFAALAGVDPTDHRAAAAGLPPIDSLDLWPYLSGATEASPRTEIFASGSTLIVGDMKLIGANATAAGEDRPEQDVAAACWMGPRYPNGTQDPGCNRAEPCAANGGCLYNVTADPSEYVDLAASRPKELRALQARLAELQKTVFNPVRTGGGGIVAKNYARDVYHGYWGPFLFP